MRTAGIFVGDPKLEQRYKDEVRRDRQKVISSVLEADPTQQAVGNEAADVDDLSFTSAFANSRPHY